VIDDNVAGNEAWNRSVFRRWRKFDRDGTQMTLSGRVWQFSCMGIVAQSQTSCCSSDSERPHRRCRLLNKVENIDRTPCPSQWAGGVSQNCPFPWGDRAPCNTLFLYGPLKSTPSRHLSRFIRFCRARGCNQRTGAHSQTTLHL